MLAELIDAVVGVDTHRDTHEVEIALPTGTASRTSRHRSVNPAPTSASQLLDIVDGRDSAARGLIGRSQAWRPDRDSRD
jgi:hypothetical protein